MIVADSNIIFPLVIGTPQSEAARALFERDGDWRTESFMLIEFSNILATYERAKLISNERAHLALHEVEELFGDDLITVPLHAALSTAAQYQVPAYDARYLTLAKSLGTRLVTEDRKLRAAAPEWTQSLDEALSK